MRTFISINSPPRSHGCHARVPDARVQSLCCQILTVLRLENCCRQLCQLWHCWQWSPLCTGPDGARCSSREDVCCGRYHPPNHRSRITNQSSRFDTNDSLYDLAWSEINENQLIAACGDGSLKLFDLGVNDFPVMNFHEHKRETFSVAWNPITKDTFISSSWDGTVKIVSLISCPPFATRTLY